MASPISNHSESDHEDTPSTQSRSGRLPGARTWQDWEVEVLVGKARDKRPWEAERTNGGQKLVWMQIANELRDEHDNFSRQGPACQSRFNAIMREAEAGLPSETEDEEAEDLDDHSKTLREVCCQRKKFQQQRKSATQAAKAKISADQAIGEGYRLAALTGMVPREELSDLTRGESLSHPVDTEQGDHSDLVPRRKRARTDADTIDLDNMISTLEAKDEEYDKELEDARREDREQHAELKERLDHIATTMDRLTDAIIDDRRMQQTLLAVTNKLVSD
ncbi:hypothetical protein FRC07_003725 [Ceratobasidium sp. 392]|nr:hypothetical protein FRC07_003725 [Ceratobasidium sp. 392]